MKENKSNQIKVEDLPKDIKEIKDPELRKKLYKEAREGKIEDHKQLKSLSKNLIPLNERSPEEAREIRRKGAEAMHRLKGEKKNAKQILEEILPLYANNTAINNNETIPEDIKKEILSNKNIKVTQYHLVFLSMLYKAQNGDVKAAEYISNHFGDVVTKEVHNTNENILTQADRDLIAKLSARMGVNTDIVDVEE